MLPATYRCTDLGTDCSADLGTDCWTDLCADCWTDLCADCGTDQIANFLGTGITCANISRSNSRC